MRFVEAMQNPSAGPDYVVRRSCARGSLRCRTRRAKGKRILLSGESTRMLSAPGSTWVHREINDRVHLYGVREWELRNRLTRCAARRQWLP